MQKIRRRISKISKITLFDIKKGIAKKQWYIPNTAYKEEGDKIKKRNRNKTCIYLFSF